MTSQASSVMSLLAIFSLFFFSFSRVNIKMAAVLDSCISTICSVSIIDDEGESIVGKNSSVCPIVLLSLIYKHLTDDHNISKAAIRGRGKVIAAQPELFYCNG